jgi:glucuronate isomerase
MREFLDDDFLLTSDTARTLYHSHAAAMPIYDYHCHLPVRDIAEDTRFANLTQAWLAGDHYKWRAMRTNGVDERFCTGDAADAEKFKAWARTVPRCLGNPLYHWTHLELKRYFGISGIQLNEQTAERIYRIASEKLTSPEYSVRNLLRMQNVKLVCTTEDPLDDLGWHERIRREEGMDIAVHTAWRPDKAMAGENVAALNKWIDGLAALVDVDIDNFTDFVEALDRRHQQFHDQGCRLSDHGLEHCYAAEYSSADTERIFGTLRQGKELSAESQFKFKSAVLFELALMDHRRGWVQQFHLGALRNNNTRLLTALGPDTGFDSIGDWHQAQSLSHFLDRLDSRNRLPKTVLYNLNPADNAVLATMIGNYQDGSVAGKMQFGAAWWFLDQKHGMEEHLKVLSSLGLLSRFVGMLTDSRSFLSYPRHEYFRRLLCNFLGRQVDHGELPRDMGLLGTVVEDICFNNAKDYFPMEIHDV